MYKPTTSCGEIGLILHEIYQIVLGYKANGVFVEVGANDGKTGSFTYNLANTGWKGLYIEPVPRIYQECKKNHENNDVIVLNDGGTLSTMDAEMFNLYKKMKWTRNNFRNSYSTNVTVDKLDNILNKYSFKPDFDVFVLDVEGYEEKVLNGFSLNEFKPKIVIVEIPDQLLVNDVVDNVYIRNDLITKENKNKLKECTKDVKYQQFNNLFN